MRRTIQTAEALGVQYEQWKALNEIDAVSAAVTGLTHNFSIFAAGPDLGIGKEGKCPPKCPDCPTKHDAMQKSHFSNKNNYYYSN